MRISICLLACLLFSIAHVNLAMGQVDPDGSVIFDFTEDFESGVANFTNAERELATLFQTGGVGDSAFVRAATDPDFQGVVFRAEIDSRGPGPASGGAFAGDYIASNVESVSFFLRHDNTEDATFSARFATGNNFPGSIVGLGTLAPGEFQEFTIDLTDTSPFFNESAPLASFLDDIGNIQITTSTENGGGFNVDLDNFQIRTSASAVPEPSSLALLVGSAGLFVIRRR